MEIYVVRHTPVSVGKDTCYGQSNVDLAKSFIEDAKHLKLQLPYDFDSVYSSPLERCKKLANTLDLRNIKYESALMELNFGKWENQKWKDINKQELNVWMDDFVNIKPPDGECLTELYERVSTFLNQLRQSEHQKVLLITHAGVIRCIWAYLLEIPLKNIFKIPVEFGEIFKFKLGVNPLMDSIKQKI